jgi:hypothetical protein
MPKFLTPEIVRLVLPVVVSIAKDLAPKTETTVDDRIVDALEKAISNPVIFELLLSVLFASDAPKPESVAAEDVEAAMALEANAEVVKGLFALAA